MKLTQRIESLKEVIVIDDLTGSGKTTMMLQMINQAPQDQKFIFISPYLDECDRVVEGTKHTRTFHQPSNQNSDGTKLKSFKDLLTRSENIVSTHALFEMWDDDVLAILQLSNYTLVMDETVKCIEHLNVISKFDVDSLIGQKYISVDENTQRIYWIEDEYVGRFEDIRKVADTGRLYLHDDNCVIWSYPADMFRAFSEVFVLTYLFEGSLLKNYFTLHSVPYRKKSVGIREEHDSERQYELVEYLKPDLAKQKDLIQILHHERLNSIGDSTGKSGRDQLSFTKMSKLTKGSQFAKQIDSNLDNVFRRKFGLKGHDVMWTCNKALNDKKILGNGYRKSWVASNIRATNDYRHKTGLAFIRNVYMNPQIAQFFDSNGITVDHDTYALSTLIQWIYRSAVRDGKPIQLYVPSQRMRGLLMEWMDS